MSGFSAEWLALREPFDHRARRAALDAFALPAQVERWRAASGGGLPVVDLACGSGSNLRALAPRLGRDQRWRLVDHDPALLAAVPDALAAWAHRQGHRLHVRGTGRIDIAGPDFSAEVTLEPRDLARDLHRLPLAHASLVTGAALLDLVSADWLAAMVRRAREARAAMCFALTVDGQVDWTPADPQDAAVHRLFASHQRRDKGFGPALGGQAIAAAQRLMRAAGYAVHYAPSDWVVAGEGETLDQASGAPALLAAMIDGTAEAALAQAGVSQRQAVHDWQARRHAMRHATRLRVGHVDLFATLP